MSAARESWFGRLPRDSGPARMLRAPSGRWGAVLAALVVLSVLVGPLLVSHGPNTLDPSAQLHGPSWAHPFGTDEYGRDELARTLAGGRRSLLLVLVALGSGVGIGIAVGVVAAMAGGVLDTLVVRVLDVFLTLPGLIVTLALIGALGAGYGNLMISLAAAFWPQYARLTRSYLIAGRGRADVIAARSAGIGWARAVVGHLLPAAAARVAVLATVDVAHLIMVVAGLSFLGLGVQAPAAEWGAMLYDARLYITDAPWLLAAPAAAIGCSVVAANLLGEAAQSAVAEHRPVIRRRPRPTSTPRTDTPRTITPRPTRDPVLIFDGVDVVYGDGAVAARDVGFAVESGECLALVGESGCGKTTLARAALGLLPSDAQVTGSITLDGTQVVGATQAVLRSLRGRSAGYVPQDPASGFDPIRSVAHHLGEAWRAHGERPSAARIAAALSRLGIPDATRRAGERPHQWSGGMLQRAAIAAATAHDPPLVIADEPTSALDAERAEDILDATRGNNHALLLVSHDLALVAGHADRVAVLYAGSIVEIGDTADVFAQPRHPYTAALLSAIPRRGHGLPQPLPGAAPNPHEPTAGCPFAPRCPRVIDRCLGERPALIDGVACVRAS